MKELKTIPKSLFIKVEAGAVGGIPDIIGSIRGRFVAIELKKDAKTKPSKLQYYMLEALNKIGAHTFVCYPENMISVLAELHRIGSRPKH